MRRPVKPGQLYLDCDHHSVLCTRADPVIWDSTGRLRRLLYALTDMTEADDWDIAGISLLDASRPRSCSAKHCALAWIPLGEAMARREFWDKGHRARAEGRWAPVINPFIPGPGPIA